MKNVVILSNEIGIIYKFRFEFLKELIKKNNVFLISPKTEGQDFFLTEILNLKIKYIEIDLDRRSYNPLQEIFILKQYYKFLKEIKPDKVLTYTIKPNIYGGIVSQMLKIKYISTITGIGTAFQDEGILKRIVIFLNKIALRKAKRVFFQNNTNLDIYLKNKIVKKEQCQLVNGSGVNLEKFKCDTKIKEEPIKILFIGRIMKEKGIDEYLEVVKRIKRKYSNKVFFQILGQYEEEKYKVEIDKLTNEGNLEYLGVSNDVRKEISQVHCLVNPSWHEGMSNVLLEAGAMKRFLIASDIPGCKEIVLDKETGFTFEKKNIDNLEEKIERFISLSESEYEKYIEKSYDHIRNNFSREKVIEEYLKVINE